MRAVSFPYTVQSDLGKRGHPIQIVNLGSFQEMRDILSKVMAGSMIAGAALVVAACSGGNEANNSAESNAMGTDVFAPDNGSGLNGTDSLGGNGAVSNDLSNASNAVSNASEAVNAAATNAAQ